MIVTKAQNKWLVPRYVSKWKKVLNTIGEVIACLSIFAIFYLLNLLGYICQ